MLRIGAKGNGSFKAAGGLRVAHQDHSPGRGPCLLLPDHMSILTLSAVITAGFCCLLSSGSVLSMSRPPGLGTVPCISTRMLFFGEGGAEEKSCEHSHSR